METYSLKFDDVSDIFNTGKVWVDGYELYWYRYIWSALEKQGLTMYSTDVEKHVVLLYSFTLVHIYQELSYALCREYVSSFYYLISDFFSDVTIGQISAGFLHDGEVFEEPSDLIEEILPHLKYKVFEALRKEVSACDVFVWFYCSAIELDKDLIFPKKTISDSEDFENDDEDCYEINSYEDFCSMVKKVYDVILDSCDNSENYELFEYLYAWMP